MRSALILFFAFVIGFPGSVLAQAAPPAAASDLAGLWKAKRWFGPEAHGPLILRREAGRFAAEMAGHVVPVRADKGALAFELPDGEGAFKGRLDASGAVLGHWYPPASSAVLIGFRYASPVRLEPAGPGRWDGVVAPVEDTFTFYLLATSQADGSMGVVLRNPERDYGNQLKVHVLVRDGDVVKLIGVRGGKDVEVARGRFDADNQVLTLAFPGRGGWSYDFVRDGDDSDFYPRGKHPGRYVYHPPPARDDGWPVGTLEEAGIDRAAMERFVQSVIDEPMEPVDAHQIHGLLIARHGRLVLEEYFHGENRDRMHDTRSASKSLTATLVGAAMEAGAPLKLSTPVYQLMNGGTFPPDLEPRKRAMTLENLLTMTSGYFCDDNNDAAPGNEVGMLDQTAEPDYLRFTLSLPMAFDPGKTAIYCSINPNLALGMTGRALGEDPMASFDRMLGRPLKITSYGWMLDPSGQPYGGGSVQMLPRDFMKLGQLMLNGGTWQGRRLLDRDYVRKLSSTLYTITGRGYGFGWWTVEYPYRGRTVHAFFADGRGGQWVIVIPELDLVAAAYSGNYFTKGQRVFQQEFVPNVILPAVH